MTLRNMPSDCTVVSLSDDWLSDCLCRFLVIFWSSELPIIVWLFLGTQHNQESATIGVFIRLNESRTANHLSNFNGRPIVSLSF